MDVIFRMNIKSTVRYSLGVLIDTEFNYKPISEEL